MGYLVCPICGATNKSNGDGDPFRSITSVAFHIAGKARVIIGRHQQWILSIFPGIDTRDSTINQLGKQIHFHVDEALAQQAFRLESQTQAGKEPDGEVVTVDSDMGEVVLQRETTAADTLPRYTQAYESIWMVETELLKFVGERLGETFGAQQWWRGFPLSVKQQCVERAHIDGDTLQIWSYIDFPHLAEVIKLYPQEFKVGYDRLLTLYSDPKSEFHRRLADAYKMRNNAMHPLKGMVPTNDILAKLRELADAVKVFVGHATA